VSHRLRLLSGHLRRSVRLAPHAQALCEVQRLRHSGDRLTGCWLCKLLALQLRLLHQTVGARESQ